jgi:hypothetical protein
MNRRFLIWSVAGAIFLVTLAISSWNSGLWQSEPVEQTHNIVPRPLVLANQTEAPLRPFAPPTPSAAVPDPAPTAAPELAAASPPPPPAAPPPAPEYPPDSAPLPPPEMTEGLLESGPGVDNEEVLARRDRARAERRNAESH